jgi:hypothetical protein
MACAPASRASQLVWGVALMAAGAAFMLKNLGYLSFVGRQWWPLLPIVMGLGFFLGQPRSDGRRGGLWLVFVGLLMLAHTQRVLRLRDSWPLFLVVAGAGLAAETLRPSRRDKDAGGTT